MGGNRRHSQLLPMQLPVQHGAPPQPSTCVPFSPSCRVHLGSIRSSVQPCVSRWRCCMPVPATCSQQLSHAHTPRCACPCRLSSYGEEQLHWLDGQLAEGRHTLVMVSRMLLRCRAELEGVQVAARLLGAARLSCCSRRSATRLRFLSCQCLSRLGPLAHAPSTRRRTSLWPRRCWRRCRRAGAGATCALC